MYSFTRKYILVLQHVPRKESSENVVLGADIKPKLGLGYVFTVIYHAELAKFKGSLH